MRFSQAGLVCSDPGMFRVPLAALTALGMTLSPATPPHSDQKPPLVFGTDVALVQVPVFVSGRGGAAVPGLTPKDFVVEQDGRPVEIVSFRYIDTTAQESQDEIKESSAARRRFVLLFDKSFTDPAGLSRAQKAAKEFVLGSLAESDLAAVATFDFLRGLRLIANFTEDRRVLEHAIHTLGTANLTKISDPLAIAADFQATDLVRERTNDSSETPQEVLTGVLSVLVRQMQGAEEQSYKNRVRVLLDGLKELGLSLRRIPGRKQILYFSTGFNSTLLAGQDVTEQRRMSEAIVSGRIWEVDSTLRFGDASFRGEVDEALVSLTRSDSVVHAIDLSGLGKAEAYAQLPPEAQPSRDASGRESLALIAAQTGGRFFKDANDLGPVLREMADLTSRYYVLGVQPRESRPDGSFRKLRVRVKPKGLRLSHRPGFFERSGAVERPPTLQRQFEAAELLVSPGDAAAPRNTLPFRVLIVPVPTDTERQSLGIVVQIPRSSLGENVGGLEVFGYAIARSGDIEDHFAHFLRLEAAVPAAGDLKGLSFAGRFDVPPGDYTLKFLAQRPSGEASARFFEVTVPQRQASAGFLLPPLLAENPRGWVEVALKGRGEAGLPLKIEAGSGAILLRTDMSVRPGRRERLVLVAYDPETARDPAVDVDIRSVLSDHSGKRYPPGAILVERVLHDTDGRRSYVLGFTPENIPPGDYTLRIQLGEAGSVLRSYTRLKVLPGEAADAR